MNPEHYGDKYWCVKTSLSLNDDIYVHGNDAFVLDSGALVLVGVGDVPVLTIAPGEWKACYAASVLDGSAVAVVHWKGEVVG